MRDRCLSNGMVVPGCTPNPGAASVTPSGATGSGPSLYASISVDGRFVAFASYASDLAGFDKKGFLDVFVRDRCRSNGVMVPDCTPSTALQSVNALGLLGNRESFLPVISSDGRFVMFTSGASNLVADDRNRHYDVFVRDRCLSNGDAVPACTPKNALVSVTSAGVQGTSDSGTNLMLSRRTAARWLSERCQPGRRRHERNLRHLRASFGVR